MSTPGAHYNTPMQIKTRFAPSPTGYLHIGGARTALFSWLYARHHKAQFLLRIEDTDRERSTEESIQAIFDGMNWLRLDWDSPPIYQTQRFDRYEQVIQKLLVEGHAYKCYCSKERLEQLREHQMATKQKPRYDGHCRDTISPNIDMPYVIRFKNPIDGASAWNDLARGEISFENAELDDLIIARTDGVPTYNFVVVIDDWDMNITHVLRGDDHINNTPRQLNIFKALGVTPPLYGHLPMILGADGARLSKRHGAVSVMQYRDEGYLPEALLNYLVRLGWSHGDQEIFSLEEMIRHFSLDKINNSPATFNPEKLLWLNAHYITNSPADYIAAQLAWHMQRLDIDTTHGPELEAVVKVQQSRCKTLVEMAEQSRCFYQREVIYDETAKAKFFKPELKEPFGLLKIKLAAIVDWQAEKIHQVLQDTLTETGLKMGQLGPAIRVAVTGNTISPALDVTLHLLGQAAVIQRIEKAIEQL